MISSNKNVHHLILSKRKMGTLKWVKVTGVENAPLHPLPPPSSNSRANKEKKQFF